MSYAVCVTIRLHLSAAEAFRPLMEANARASREREPGCLVFDVLTDPDQPQRVFLYELYTDAAAFGAHLETAHFKAFDAETAAMIVEKSLTRWPRVAR